MTSNNKFKYTIIKSCNSSYTFQNGKNKAYHLTESYILNTMFHESEWYGNWGAVIASIILATFIFTIFLAKPKKIDWRSYGLTEAFIISLFTEMFGIPLTIYALTSLLNIDIPANGLTGHLLATTLSYLSIIDLENAVTLVMTISLIIIGGGLLLLIGGWYQVYNAREGIADKGLYGLVRHPQYLGIILIMTGFIIQWPTIPTLIMYPILVYIYHRQSIKEEKIMIDRFGEEYLKYMERTPRYNVLRNLFS